ncbi:MAG TPA: DUF2752 domain-containing protein [Bacteroidales bacterium]|nr:DUF2752 domain-containing protein [Bacteroidales bacterium]HPS27161.1 DUF2752 domain-containing protein [Bacteroidales bacterium]
MLQNIINWLESNSLPCLSKTIFGIECPGCGTQRAIIELLKGNFTESLKAWPALLPVALMMCYLALFLVFRFKNGHKILVVFFIVNALIITGNYLYKIVAHAL